MAQADRVAEVAIEVGFDLAVLLLLLIFFFGSILRPFALQLQAQMITRSRRYQLDFRSDLRDKAWGGIL